MLPVGMAEQGLAQLHVPLQIRLIAGQDVVRVPVQNDPAPRSIIKLRTMRPRILSCCTPEAKRNRQSVAGQRTHRTTCRPRLDGRISYHLLQHTKVLHIAPVALGS